MKRFVLYAKKKMLFEVGPCCQYWLYCDMGTTVLHYNYILKITFWKYELRLAKGRVSFTVWKTWKDSLHYTPSHTPSWTVWRIYALIKNAIYGLFYKRNRKHFPQLAFDLTTLICVLRNSANGMIVRMISPQSSSPHVALIHVLEIIH